MGMMEWFIIGCFIGFTLGTLVMALMVMVRDESHPCARKADRP